MARKRQIQEVDDFNKVDDPVASAYIHGVITSLSPLKKGRTSNYFDGTVCDGTSKLRFIGFSTKQQKALSTFSDSKQPIQISNCEIKKARRGDKMEIMLKGSTKITGSPKKISVSDLDFKDEAAAKITLDELESKEIYERVTVKVKVQTCMEIVQVKTGKKKQDIIVADGAGVAKVTLWEENVGTLKKDESYLLQNFAVREYDSSKYLAMSSEGSQVVSITDIGEVKEVRSRSKH